MPPPGARENGAGDRCERLYRVHCWALRRLEKLTTEQAWTDASARGADGLSDSSVSVVPYDPSWAGRFEAEARVAFDSAAEHLEKTLGLDAPKSRAARQLAGTGLK